MKNDSPFHRSPIVRLSLSVFGEVANIRQSKFISVI